jgi:hypothetical protein
MLRENMQQYPVVIGIIHRYIQSTLDNEWDFDKCQFYHTKIFNVYFWHWYFSHGLDFWRDKGLIWVWHACPRHACPRQASHRTIIDRCLVYILKLVSNKCILIN